MKQYLGRLILLTIGLLIIALAFTSAPQKPVTFRLVDEQENAIPSTDVYVFNGDVQFKFAPDTDPYPYGPQAKKSEWFIGAVKTDEEGKFTFDVGGSVQNFCFNAGHATRIICIEKASDTGHTQATEHLRVVGFENGSTKVLYNDIYDLKHKTVKRLWPDERTEEHSFTSVTLVAHPDNSPHILGMNQ